MKNYLTSNQCRAVLCGVAGLATLLTNVQAAESGEPTESKWKVSVSANAMFNLSAKFKGHPGLATPTSPNAQPGAENYDNGFAGLDISGDPNFSSYWGYSDASQQIVSGPDVTGLTFERTTLVGGSSGSSSKDADVSFGGEVLLRRELFKRENLRGGLEFGFSYNPVSVSSSSSYTADGERTSYTYNMAAPIDSTFFPPPGYQGSSSGIGPLINPTPIVGPTTSIPGAVLVTGSRNVDADIFGFRVGPYLELPVTKKFSAAISAGVMVAVIADDVSWTENFSVNTSTTTGFLNSTSSASESSTGVVAGGYVGLDAGYEFTKNWSVVAGARFQSLGSYQHSLGAGKMELDLGSAFSVNVGIGWSF